MMKRWLYLGLFLLWPTLVLAQQSTSTSIFGVSLTPVPNDLSLRYLNDMFGYVESVLTENGPGNSQLLGTLFGVFNSAILVLGGIVVLYTFFIGTLRTAHEGEALGKEWSSIWIPLRIVAGIALLIPKASGYSFIQVLMMMIIVWGIGVADSMWSTAVTYMSNSGNIITAPGNGPNGDATKLIDAEATFLRSLTCVEMLQLQFTRFRNDQITKGNTPIDPVPNFKADIINAINNSAQANRPLPLPNSNYYNTNGECGNINWTDVYQQLPTEIQQSPQGAQWVNDKTRSTAVSSLANSLFPWAQAIAQNYYYYANNLPGSKPLGQMNNSGWGGVAPNTGNFLVPNTILTDAAATYYGLMSNTVAAIQTLANSPQMASQWASKAIDQGWAMAGSYYFDIIQANQQVHGILDKHTPDASFTVTDFTQEPNITNYLGGPSSIYVIQLNTLLNGSSGTQQNKGNDYIVSTDSPFMSGLTQNSSASSMGMSGAGGKASSAAGGVSSSMGGFLGSLSSSGTENPVVGIAVYGDTLVTIAFVCMLLMMLIGFGATLGLGCIPFCSVGAAGVSIVTAITSFLTPVFITIIIAGLTMAYYLPMIPFIIFSFGVIGWFISVVEAMLAAPLVALGISHPEGSHPILGKADPAVALMINVFLRPTFMIFGMLFGMMISYVGVWLLNEGFGHAFGKATSTATDPFKPIAMIIIYVSIVMQILQKGFSLIYIIPDSVLRWINMNVSGMGGEAEAERAIGEGARGAFQETGQRFGAGVEASTSTGAASGEMIKEGLESRFKSMAGTPDGITPTDAKEGSGVEGKEGSAGQVGASGSTGGDAGMGAGSGKGTSEATAGGSIPGPKGDKGDDGSKGYTGAQGIQGMAGQSGDGKGP